jgi:predicted transcriptional regulator
MSGFPNSPDIAELRSALEEFRKESDAIERAQGELRRAELALAQASERRLKADKKVRELMTRMDCSATGNNGYENRIFTLLTGLAEHAEQYGRTHQ